MLNNLFNFIYIGVIILGGITLTLTIILNAREKDRKHRAVLIFIASIFVYMITDFITYYFLSILASSYLVFILITLSDTFFCVLTTAWVYILLIMTGLGKHIKIEYVIIPSAFYLVSSQILSIYLGRYDSYVLHIENGIWKTVLQTLNAGYDIFIIIIGIVCIRFLFKNYEAGRERRLNLVMSLLLIGYMCYIAYWDYSVWLKTEDNLNDIYAIDPLILMYAIFNVFTIYYFYIKDPLKIKESQIAPEEAIKKISRQYGLSEREKEVLSLINCGMSNPQIAAELFISENTVKRHINNIFKKTGTQSRHEIIFRISNIK